MVKIRRKAETKDAKPPLVVFVLNYAVISHNNHLNPFKWSPKFTCFFIFFINFEADLANAKLGIQNSLRGILNDPINK